MRLLRRGDNSRHDGQPSTEAALAAQFNGTMAPFHLAYSYHDLPGAGANQWSYDRLALPVYSPGGNGIPNGADLDLNDRWITVNAGQIVFAPSSCPVGVVMQGAVLTMLGDPGTPAGYFAMQPLTTTSPADAAFSARPMPQEEAAGAYGVEG